MESEAGVGTHSLRLSPLFTHSTNATPAPTMAAFSLTRPS